MTTKPNDLMTINDALPFIFLYLIDRNYIFPYNTIYHNLKFNKGYFMRKIVLLFLILPVFLSNTHAQNWYVINGKYAKVEYQRGLEAVADTLLEIAELAIPRLAKMHGLPISSFDKKPARIILSDAPDIANGYALSDVVVIYALSSMYVPVCTGADNWYKHVLTHELAHNVTFRKIKRKLNLFGEIANLAVPRWFYEGIAQYYAETWSIYRGDIYIKNALLSGKLNYSSLENLNDGRLLYAAGHAFVRFLADQYGDSSLVQLMSYKPHSWYFNFDEAFKSVYGKEPKELFPDLIRCLILYYGDKLADYPVSELSDPLPSFGYRAFQILPLASADSTYLISTQLDNVHRFKTALIVQIKSNHVSVIKNISNNYATDLFLSPDQNYIAFGSYQFGTKSNQTSIRLKWLVYDRKNDKAFLIDKNLRARYAAFTPENDLIISNITPFGSILTRYNLKTLDKSDIFQTSMPIGHITVLPDGYILFDAQQANGNRDIFILSDGNLKSLINDPTDDRTPVILNDSLIAFNRYEDQHAAIAFYNLKSGVFKTPINDQYAYWLHSADTAKQELIVSTWQPGRKDVFSTIPIDTFIQASVKPYRTYQPTRYAKWTTKKFEPVNLLNLPDTTIHIDKRESLAFPQASMINLLSFALPTYDPELGLGLYGITLWVDALQRQMLSATSILYEKDFDQSLLALSHILKLYNSNLFTSFYHGPVIFSHQDGSYIKLYQDIGAFEWNKICYIAGNPRLYYIPSLAYTGYYYQLKETIKDIPDNYGYHGPRLSFSINYLLPSRLYPVLPKRLFSLSLNYFKSLNDQYDFSISQAQIKLASNLYFEKIGFKTNFSYIKQQGDLPPLKSVGIDRFYEFDVPRDFIYTKTVRGVREDIPGKELYFSTSELVFMVTQKTNYSILFLPINNLAVSAFFDYANIKSDKNIEVYSYGSELSFGENFARFGVGYAVGKYSDNSNDEHIYFRFSLFLPDK